MLGTIVNTGTIIAGSLIGIMIHSRLPRKYVNIVFQGIGLFALVLGISMSLSSDKFLLILISIVTGTIIGQYINIDRRLKRFAIYIQKKTSGKSELPVLDDDVIAAPHAPRKSRSAKFTEGFITASMLFCVGSMSILGALEDGMGSTPTLLYTKSIMDGVSSVILASSFGIAVIFSCIPVLIYQGGLTILASLIMRFMSDGMIADFTAVGGVLLIGMALNIMKIKDVNVVNMLPSLLTIILLSFFWG